MVHCVKEFLTTPGGSIHNNIELLLLVLGEKLKKKNNKLTQVYAQQAWSAAMCYDNAFQEILV